MNNYVSGKEASERLGVHQRTLMEWDRKKKIETIRTPGNKRLYNIEKFLKEKECEQNKDKCKNDDNKDDIEDIKEKQNICYVRVSSMGQKDDMQRQKEVMKLKYPTYTIIEDIGSGMNLNKRGIRRIIKLAIKGKINELVVAYKDRLTRFGYELIEDLIKEYSNGKIIVLNQKENQEPEEELAQDIMQLMNVFVAKMNGLRKYKKKDKQENNNTKNKKKGKIEK